MDPRAALLAATLLLAPPARAGLTCDASSVASALDAALGQFRSSNKCGQDAALDWLNRLFPKGLPKDRVKEVLFNGEADPGPYRKPKGAAQEMTPITADVLDLAARHIAARVKDGGVTGGCTSDVVSGYWGPEPDCPYAVCGKVELGRALVARVTNSGFDGEMPLRDADQAGNTVTHEAVHVFVSYFRRVYGAEDADTVDGGLTEDFSYATFFNGCTLFQVTNGQTRLKARIQYKAPSDMYDPKRTGNEQTARQVAQGMQWCFAGKPNPFYAAMLGAGNVSTCAP